MAKTIGILTGGGDCPGLNAVIRAVVRSSDAAGWDCVSVLEGWRGLVEAHFQDLGPKEVSGILPRFPNLKLTYAEGQLGWIPYILERADKVWEHNRGWGDVDGIFDDEPMCMLTTTPVSSQAAKNGSQ